MHFRIASGCTPCVAACHPVASSLQPDAAQLGLMLLLLGAGARLHLYRRHTVTRHLTLAALALVSRERARLAVLSADSADAIVIAGVQFHTADALLWQSLGNAITARVHVPFSGGK